MWPDERVATLVMGQFLPARVHVKDDAAQFKRYAVQYGAHWTPNILLLDHTGAERHRIEGFLPVEDLVAQLSLGLGHIAFNGERYAEAERRFRSVVDRYPDTEAAPEALYWAGVSRYKNVQDPRALGETAQAFDRHYQQTAWAKKASVWK